MAEGVRVRLWLAAVLVAVIALVVTLVVVLAGEGDDSSAPDGAAETEGTDPSDPFPAGNDGEHLLVPRDDLEGWNRDSVTRSESDVVRFSFDQRPVTLLAPIGAEDPLESDWVVATMNNRWSSSGTEIGHVNGEPVLLWSYEAGGSGLPSGSTVIQVGKAQSESATEPLLLASRRLTGEQLLDLAEFVEVDDQGRIAVSPGAWAIEVIGELDGGWLFPEETAVQVEYSSQFFNAQSRRTERVLAVRPVSPGEQLVFRAMMHDSNTPYPAPSMHDPRTSQAVVEVGVAGRRGWIGTIDWDTRVLVVEGDPGVLVVSKGNLPPYDNFAPEAFLVHLAEALEVVEPEDLSGHLTSTS